MQTLPASQLTRRIGSCALSFGAGVCVLVGLLWLADSLPASVQASGIRARPALGAARRPEGPPPDAALLSSFSALTLTGQITSSSFGRAVATAGDVNGDGYADVVIGAPDYLSSTGQVYLYLGSANGLSSVPALTLTGESPYSYFGFPVQTAGDVNGDGYSDVMIGANGYLSFTGRAYLYLGSAGGLSATPAFTVTGTPQAGVGAAVGTAGDVNGDGYSDVFVSSAFTVHVYLGSANGVIATPVFTAPTFVSPGVAAGTAGDVNGDGYSDIIVGDFSYISYTGQVRVYLGSSTGLSLTPAFTATGEALDDRFGTSVGTAGDVNGDGYADVIVGATGYGNSLGRAYLYLGGASGLDTSPALTITGEAANDQFGFTVQTAGDTNGDGYADVIIGTPNPLTVMGRAYVYLGSANGLQAAAAFSATGEGMYTFFGESVGTAGDVNGDGYAEIIVGASGYGNFTGRAYIYHGAADMLRLYLPLILR
jgi:hypothetical protein